MEDNDPIDNLKQILKFHDIQLEEVKTNLSVTQKQLVRLVGTSRDSRFRDSMRLAMTQFLLEIDKLKLIHTEFMKKIQEDIVEEEQQRDSLISSLENLALENHNLRKNAGRISRGEPPKDDETPVLGSDLSDFFDAEEASDAWGHVIPQEEEEPTIIRRKSLPFARTNIRYSMWSFLKNCVGKDLSRIPLPVLLNEPISFLQRLGENFQYEDLLVRAHREQGANERLLFVTIFALSPFASALGRTFKPFNPMLSETFEQTHRGFFFVSEQVSHHPPVSAYHCCRKDVYETWGNIQVDTRLHGNSVSVNMIESLKLYINTNGGNKELFHYKRPKLKISNIIVGNFSHELLGGMEISSESNCVSKIEFQKKSWFNSHHHLVRGLIYDCNGSPAWAICGNWGKVLLCKALSQESAGKTLGNMRRKSKVENPQISADSDFDKYVPWSEVLSAANHQATELWDSLWVAIKRGPNTQMYYSFTPYTIELNEIGPEYKTRLPPTDSRLRPDQRALENGDADLATTLKFDLEEKQRQTKRLRDLGVIPPHSPKWFTKRTVENDYFPILSSEHSKGSECQKLEYWRFKYYEEIPYEDDIFL
eukprot:GHVP01017868.1.p1 GENE.GHVP01017868.1~~GHVP01017868.1.p1  ORF type:complete len:592 (-),score=93.74 GHVP01017868.1:2522-4297(-)